MAPPNSKRRHGTRQAVSNEDKRHDAAANPSVKQRSRTPTSHSHGSRAYFPSAISTYFTSPENTGIAGRGQYASHGQMMSLPGLGLEEPQDTSYGQGSQTQSYDLNKETEWRFEVTAGRSINVKILTGSCELFGTELVLGRQYTFVATKAAIYTWTGCTIEVWSDHGSLSAALTSEYIAEETPMHEYINTHFVLESLREQAVKNNIQAPRVLVLGPDNAGKTTLCKILTGYAIRSGRSPVVVNLDPAEGVLSIPGTLTATLFKTLIEVEEGWGSAPMSGPNGEIPVKLPLVYYYGSTVPDEKAGIVFKNQTTRLALAVQGRLAQDMDAKSSGIVVDTPGSLATTRGYDILSHIVSELQVNCIVCLGSERLYSDMVKRFDGTPISGSRTGAAGEQEKIGVVKLSKSGGVAERDATYMRALRDFQTKTYFYGNPKVGAGIALQPRQQQVDFDSLTVWRRISPHAGATSMAGYGPAGIDDEDSFLPGGADDDELAPPKAIGTSVPLPASQIFERLTKPVAALRNCVLAVLNCEPEPSNDEQAVLRDSTVMGFLYVTDVDEARGRVSLLSPVAGRVPARALVWAEGMDGILGLT